MQRFRRLRRLRDRRPLRLLGGRLRHLDARICELLRRGLTVPLVARRRLARDHLSSQSTRLAGRRGALTRASASPRRHSAAHRRIHRSGATRAGQKPPGHARKRLFRGESCLTSRRTGRGTSSSTPASSRRVARSASAAARAPARATASSSATMSRSPRRSPPRPPTRCCCQRSTAGGASRRERRTRVRPASRPHRRWRLRQPRHVLPRARPLRASATTSTTSTTSSPATPGAASSIHDPVGISRLSAASSSRSARRRTPGVAGCTAR